MELFLLTGIHDDSSYKVKTFPRLLWSPRA